MTTQSRWLWPTRPTWAHAAASARRRGTSWPSGTGALRAVGGRVHARAGPRRTADARGLGPARRTREGRASAICESCLLCRCLFAETSAKTNDAVDQAFDEMVHKVGSPARGRGVGAQGGACADARETRHQQQHVLSTRSCLLRPPGAGNALAAGLPSRAAGRQAVCAGGGAAGCALLLLARPLCPRTRGSPPRHCMRVGCTVLLNEIENHNC